MQLGVLGFPDASFSVLTERWRRLEEVGFDQLWLPDHSAHYRTREAHWLDGWTALAAAAQATTGIRIGTLVSNPIIRPPALLAREAIAVDQLSRGRLELGIGTGIARFDHEAMGVDYWPPRERAARFAEYVELVDALLRAPGSGYRFEGRYFRAEGGPAAPGPVQRPRPPITVGGQSPTALRVAAARADRWNTHGPFDASIDEILELTRAQNARLDELCTDAGRDPAALRRSLLLYAALDPWESSVDVRTVLERFSEAGIEEFVVFWPPVDRVGELETIAALKK